MRLYHFFWYVDMMKSILGLREMCTWYLRIKKVDIPAVRKVSLARAVKRIKRKICTKIYKNYAEGSIEIIWNRMKLWTSNDIPWIKNPWNNHFLAPWTLNIGHFHLRKGLRLCLEPCVLGHNEAKHVSFGSLSCENLVPRQLHLENK